MAQGQERATAWPGARAGGSPHDKSLGRAVVYALASPRQDDRAVLAALASLPIVLVLVAMTQLGWRAARAGLAGLIAALLLALSAFGLGERVHGELGPARALLGAGSEAGFTAVTILWIVFPALCLYELQERSGAFEVLRRGLGRISDDPRVLALLVAWFFALFMEGAAGFGTPVALAAPILVGLGFSPVRAVTLTLIGHAAGVSFGAVGTPMLPQMAATGLSGADLAPPAAALHALCGLVLIAFLLRLAGEGRPSARHLLLGALAAFLFFAPSYALARFVGPELPSLGGALSGGVVFALVVTRHGASGAEGPAGGALWRAALPYLVLLALVLVTRLVGPVREALAGFSVSWTLFGAFSGKVSPLTHPGTLLLGGFVLGGLTQGRSFRELAEAAHRALLKLGPVVTALLAMLGLSRVMVHAGMIQALATAAAKTGPAWPLLSPFVGVLGTFVTGSATASNILFAELAEATAKTLALPVAAMQGGQSFGAAVGNIVCPHNVVAGGATVGLGGQEGEVLRATVLACLVYALAGGLALLFSV